MTAAGGIIHEEYHSSGYAKTGGPFRMVQLWVNLPAKDKMAPGAYQGIVAADIPVVDLPDGIGTARVIAGDYAGTAGPARTFTPINLWDMKLKAQADLRLDLPEGHTAMLVVLDGQLSIDGEPAASDAQMLLLSREGTQIDLHADAETSFLVLTGEPIDEPIAGHGPFVMNTREEIVQAFEDFNNGLFVRETA
jgi:redox-sensitive bicupin YhaK (pirin superfamily)